MLCEKPENPQPGIKMTPHQGEGYIPFSTQFAYKCKTAHPEPLR